MPDLAKLLNEKIKLRKQIVAQRQDLTAVDKLKKRLQRIQEQIKKLGGN